MNSVSLVGRLTKDFEVRYSQGDSPMAIARGGIAVNRRKKDEADFINLLAFGATAENLEKYFHKGSRIGINGHIQTGSYEKDGHKVYTADVVVDQFDFIDTKAESGSAPAPAKADDGFLNLPEGIDDDELPFK